MFSWIHLIRLRRIGSASRLFLAWAGLFGLLSCVACQSMQAPLSRAWDVVGSAETGSALVQEHALQLALRGNKPEALVKVLLQDALVEDFDIAIAFDQFHAGSQHISLLAQLTTPGGEPLAKATLGTLSSVGHTRGISAWIQKPTGGITEREPTGTSGGSIRITRTGRQLELSMVAEGGTPIVVASDPDFGSNPVRFEIQLKNNDLFATADIEEDSHVRIHRLVVVPGLGQPVPDLLEQDFDISFEK